LITADGNRTLRTEKELSGVLPEKELKPVLKDLEDAAILHAAEHQGSRYFEIGHDWLARKVFEQRQQRKRAEEERRREEDQERELLRRRNEAEAKLAAERGRRRRLAVIAIVSLAVAAGAIVLGLWALERKREAVEARQEVLAQKEATDNAKNRAE